MFATTFRLAILLFIFTPFVNSFAKDEIFKSGSNIIALYQDAHRHARVIAKIPQGTRWLYPTSFKNYSSGKWVQVEYSGQKGWTQFASLILDKAGMKACMKKSADQNRHCKAKK